MKKILILTAKFGDGHNTAAANIREAIREWLAAEADEAKLFKVSEAEVAI